MKVSRKLGFAVKTAITVILILAVTLSAAGCYDFNVSYGTDSDSFSFEDMVYERPDSAVFYENAEKVLKLCHNPLKFIPVMDAVGKMNTAMFELLGAYNLCDLKYALDVTDEYYSEESAYCATEYSKMYSVYMSTMKKLLESNCGFVLYISSDSEMLDDIKNYVEPGDNYEELLERETEILQEYNTICLEKPTIEEVIAGETVIMTEQDIINDFYKTYDRNKYIERMERLTAAFSEKAGELYIELVNVRKQMVTGQFNSYEEMMFDSYMRDYTPDEAAKFCEYVKQYIAPLYLPAVQNLDLSDSVYSDDSEYYSGEKALDSIEKNISLIDANLGKIFIFMRDHDLCDVAKSDTKIDASFTSYLMDYDVPFLFSKPEGNFYDYLTIVHEFGHYYEMFVNSDYSSNIDIKEIHSTGMELLYYPYLDSVFGDKADAIREYQNVLMLQTLLTGCLYTEFQEYAFTEDDLTVEKLNEEYGRLLQEYGMASSFDEMDSYTAYQWCSVPHNFSAPFYYISYSVATFAAVELVYSSYNGYSAVQSYLDLVNLGSMNYGYCEILELSDLGSPFEEENVKTVAEALQNPEKMNSLVQSGGHYYDKWAIS